MTQEKYLLRDLKGNTELLILAEYLKNPSVKRKDIAKRIDVTEQAISQYLSELEIQGLLMGTHESPKVTRKGAQLLQERFTQLNEEIKEILRQIRVIDSCIALAGSPIKENQEVGLIMKNGRLVALPSRQSSSSGIAKSAAEKGEELLISNLSGLVELELGELLVLQAPSEIAGGSRRIDTVKTTKAMRGFVGDQVSIGDLVGEVVAQRLGLEPTIIHAPIQASMNALSKGLNVLFIGTRESVDEMLESVEELRKKTGYSIKFRVINTDKVI